MDISADICNLIIQKKDEGLTQRLIAEHLHIPQSNISSIIIRNRKTGHATPNRHGIASTSKILSPRTERRFYCEGMINPRSTARQMPSVVGGQSLTASLSTVNKSLRDIVVVFLIAPSKVRLCLLPKCV